MNLVEKIRKLENIHIVFWLLKDISWMLELKILGALMIIPTLFLCAWIIIKTIKTPEVYINIAVLCWISANSFWMLMEFFNHSVYKNYAVIPFGFGFLFVGVFFIKNMTKKQKQPNEL
jgi:hypothetical protein